MALAPNPNKGRDSAAVGALHELGSSKELKKALECPICHDVPLAPIFTCSSGHSICGKCRNGLKCGICQENLENYHRNIAIEKIVADASFWCKFLADGCPAIIKGAEYRQHVQECDFRRINCYEWEEKVCKGDQVRYSLYFKHLKEDHKIYGFDMVDNELRMPEFSNDLISDGPWPVFYIEYDDEVFLRRMNIKNSIVYWSFSLLGSQDEAARYMVKVIVYLKSDENKKCEWTIPVHSLRIPVSELDLTQQAGIPSQQLEAFCIPRMHPANKEIFKYVFDVKYEFVIRY